MPRQSKILIVDDDPVFCELKMQLLEDRGYSVTIITDGSRAMPALKEKRFDLVLLDLNLGDVGGLDILRETEALYPDLPVIIITAYASIENAVSAMKLGAYDYIAKTASSDEMMIKVHHALQAKENENKIKTLEATLEKRYAFQNIIGKSDKMQEVYKLVETVYDTDVPVLIRGETGTGKELVARAIHFNSSRKHCRFVALNCAAIHENLMESELFGHEKGSFTGAHIQRKGKLEDADGGSIFLDEIGDLPLNLQAKLLRVLQEKKFERVGSNVEISSDVRILSATNRDLQVMVKEGKFREDLFYRINVVEIKLPALRERIEDLPLLVEHFVSDFNKKHKKNTKKISPEAMQALGLYSWPGNVRELQHVVEKLVLFSSGDTITELDTKRFIPKEEGSSSESMITPGMTLEELRNKTEKEYFEKILAETRWNVTEAAKKAGVDRKTMYIKMSQYGIKRAE